jgi:hypothetical protein
MTPSPERPSCFGSVLMAADIAHGHEKIDDHTFEEGRRVVADALKKLGPKDCMQNPMNGLDQLFRRCLRD